MTENNFDKELAKFDMTDTIIAELKDKFLSMKVNSPDDIENYTICVESHKIMKKKLSAIENVRVDLKADSIAYGRKVDDRAKKWKVPVKGIVDHLAAQRKIVEDEKQRLIDEIARKEQAEKDRIAKEEEDRLEAQRQEQEETAKKLREAQEKIDADKLAIEEEKEKNRLESERIEREKVEAEEAKKRQEEEEKARIERDRMHADELKKVEAEAKEKAIRDESERTEREQREKEEADRKEKEDAERKEAMKPDIEKLKTLADDIGAVEFPEVSSDLIKEVVCRTKSDLKIIADRLRKINI